MASSVSYEYLKGVVDGLQAAIAAIEAETTVSDVTTLPAYDSNLTGTATSVISIGPQYNFFGSGHTNASMSLNNNQTYYLIRASQFAPLALYQGDATVATLWVTSGSNTYSFPLFFDATGIYFTPHTQVAGIAAGATFSFTMLLILAQAQ
jgi:hypothetical protein